MQGREKGTNLVNSPTEQNKVLFNPPVLVVAWKWNSPRNAEQYSLKMPRSMQRNKRLDYRVGCRLWV